MENAPSISNLTSTAGSATVGGRLFMGGGVAATEFSNDGRPRVRGASDLPALHNNSAISVLKFMNVSCFFLGILSWSMWRR